MRVVYIARVHASLSSVWHADDLSWRIDIGRRRLLLYVLKAADLALVPFNPPSNPRLDFTDLSKLRHQLLDREMTHRGYPYLAPAGMELIARNSNGEIDAESTFKANLSSPPSSCEIAPEDRLTPTEEQYIRTGCTTRGDGNPTLILPAGNEMDVHDFFVDGSCGVSHKVAGGDKLAYSIFVENIKDKRVLVIPGYSTNAFTFALLGAREVYGVDIDPVSIAWLKAIRNHFHDTKEKFMEHYYVDFYEFRDRFEARTYNTQTASQEPLFPMVQEALRSKKPTPLTSLHFVQACLGHPPRGIKEIANIRDVLKGREGFDFIHIPYLLGIDNGIEKRRGIRRALKDIWALANPGAIVAIAPSDYSAFFNVPNIKKLLPKGESQILGETSIGSYGSETTLFVRVLK